MMNRMIKPPPPGPGAPSSMGPGMRRGDYGLPPQNAAPMGTPPISNIRDMPGKFGERLQQTGQSFNRFMDNVEMEINGGNVFQPGSPLMQEAMAGNYGHEAQRLAQEIEQRAAFGIGIPPEMIEELNIILTRVQGAYGNPMYDRDAEQSKPQSPWVAPGFGRNLPSGPGGR